MRHLRINGSTVAMALAGIALFVSLGGPAWAKRTLIGTSDIHDNAITSRKIATGAVHNSDLGAKSVSQTKLRAGAVTNTKLAANSVSNTKLRAASVSNSKLADASVSTGKLADAAVATSKLADAAVTTGKIADAAVTNGKLAPDAVTSDKVKDASLTASDVAPNTFLAANGSAVNADALGGFPAAAYTRGSSQRVVVAEGAPDESLAVFPLGTLVGSCTIVGKPSVSYRNASSPVDVVSTSLQNNVAVAVATSNNVGNGTTIPVPNASGNPQLVTLQAAAVGPPSRVLTASVSDQFQSGTGCVFIVQQTSTG